jgi:thiamine biosynthesis lipoprotein
VTRLVHVEPIWGTVVSLHLHGPGSVPARDTVLAWLRRVDATLSRFRPDTPLARWRRGEIALAKCPPEVAEVLRLAHEACVRTGGAFDPLWGGGAPDPTGLLKGWAAERAADRALACGVSGVQVNAGGDVRAAGTPGRARPWRIGVAAPGLPGKLLDVIAGHDLRIATSGVDQRGPHVRHRGRPARGALSVTVVGPDLARADAFSTAALALGSGAGDLLGQLDTDGYPSLLVREDGSVLPSRNWPGLHHGRAGVRAA